MVNEKTGIKPEVEHVLKMEIFQKIILTSGWDNAPLYFYILWMNRLKLFSNLRNCNGFCWPTSCFESRPSNKSANKLVRAAICLFCRKFIPSFKSLSPWSWSIKISPLEFLWPLARYFFFLVKLVGVFLE